MTTRRDLIASAALLGTALALPIDAGAATPPALPPQAEFLITNAFIVSMDPHVGDIRGDIHIVNGTIEAVGGRLPASRGATVIDGRSMIAMPGLIDTHWHMWGTAARNLAGDDPKTGYFPFSRVLGSQFTAQDNARGVRLALAEAITCGITTVHNWSHNLLAPDYADAEIGVHREMGVRARFSYGYSRKTPTDATLPLDDVARVHKQYFTGADRDMLRLGIASRGPEYNTIAICQQEWGFARTLGIPITTHIGIDPAKTFGIKALDDAGLLGPDVQLVHATNQAPGDLERIRRTGTHVSVSPFTEGRTGFGFAPVTEFLATGSPISISVDTCILCGNADMFQSMRGLQNQEDGRKKSEFALTARAVLEMATINGARDLGLDAVTGSITPGKRADIVLLRTDMLNMAPFTDPVHMIVQSAHFANVDTVFIDGRPLKRHGVLTGADAGRIMADAQDTIDRVRRNITQAKT
jgi:5-methylthioadenosine/S-adenosylhomocysteine deaminase